MAFSRYAGLRQRRPLPILHNTKSIVYEYSQFFKDRAWVVGAVDCGQEIWKFKFKYQ